MYLAINNVQSDSKVVMPTYQKWISRIDKLKSIELCARVDPTALESEVLQPSDIILSFDGVDIANDGTGSCISSSVQDRHLKLC